ncbi:hypothetical protein PHET_02011 [Paragonimus heterotremus]|uniref:Uncharacterized protein n=1 Tax=Paragonimus heterotremus TaxID=100268 RepID=A0A8J4TGQ6_9TREM|nr:hypothetical protein PHET_02011 [Paragonimus heterotremus]
MNCSCSRVCWSLLWLALLLFVIWPVAFLAAWVTVTEALHVVLTFPMVCAQNIKEGKSSRFTENVVRNEDSRATEFGLWLSFLRSLCTAYVSHPAHN